MGAALLTLPLRAGDGEIIRRLRGGREEIEG